MGWDEYFLRKQHAVFVIDQSWRGRSAANPGPINAVKTGKASFDTLPTYIAAGRESAWTIFRFGPRYPVPFEGADFPFESQSEFWKQMVPDWSYSMEAPNPTVAALSQLVQKIGPAVILSHSQSGIYPFQVAARTTEGVAGIIAIEPGSCPSPDSDIRPLRKIPVLILFGDFI